jgi:hypothetical protein
MTTAPRNWPSDHRRRLDRLAREAVLARFNDDGPGPHTFVQWQGTILCADFVCECGFQGHVDEDFCFVLQCSECGRKYEVAPYLSLRPMVTDDEDNRCRPVIVTDE